MKSTTIRIPDELHERLRELAFREKVSINTLVLQGSEMVVDSGPIKETK